MPLYEYACEKCGKHFEVIQKFSDEPVTVHADCGGRAERLISAPAFHFKGSGWYVNDYAKDKSSSNGPTAKSESSGDKPAETKSTSSEGGDKSSSSSTPASTTSTSTSTDKK